MRSNVIRGLIAIFACFGFVCDAQDVQSDDDTTYDVWGSGVLDWYRSPSLNDTSCLVPQVPDDYFPIKTLQVSPGVYMSLGFGRACPVSPGSSEFVHDRVCTLNTSGAMSGMVAVTHDAGRRWTCAGNDPGLVRYHAAYAVINTWRPEPSIASTCQTLCVVSGQMVVEAGPGKLRTTATKSVACSNGPYSPFVEATPLPFPVLRATAVYHNGSLLVIGGLPPAGKPLLALTIDVDPRTCMPTGSWGLLQYVGIEPIPVEALRLDMWSLSLPPQSSATLLPIDSGIEWAVLAGGGIVVPEPERDDLDAFSFMPYVGRPREGQLYIGTGNIRSGGPPMRWDTWDTALPPAELGELTTMSLWPATYDDNLVGDSIDNETPGLLYTAGRAAFMSRSLPMGWGRLSHSIHGRGARPPQAVMPASMMHLMAAEAYSTAAIPSAHMVMGLVAVPGSVPEVWRGFAVKCQSCDAGSYKATPCRASPFDAVCSRCKDCASLGGHYMATACTATADTVCLPCTSCALNGTVQECGVDRDAVCAAAPPPEDGPISQDPVAEPARSGTYGAVAAVLAVCAGLARAAVSSRVRDMAPHWCKVEHRSDSTGAAKRAARTAVRLLWFLFTVMTYLWMDCLVMAAVWSGPRGTVMARALLAPALTLAGIALNLAGLYLAVIEQRAGQAGPETGRDASMSSGVLLLCSLPLSSLHHVGSDLARAWVTTPAGRGMVQALAPACGRDRTKGKHTASAMRFFVPSIPSLRLVSCALCDGLRLVLVFYMLLIAQSAFSTAVPYDLSTGVVIAALLNVAGAAMGSHAEHRGKLSSQWGGGMDLDGAEAVTGLNGTRSPFHTIALDKQTARPANPVAQAFPSSSMLMAQWAGDVGDQGLGQGRQLIQGSPNAAGAARADASVAALVVGDSPSLHDCSDDSMQLSVYSESRDRQDVDTGVGLPPMPALPYTTALAAVRAAQAADTRPATELVVAPLAPAQDTGEHALRRFRRVQQIMGVTAPPVAPAVVPVRARPRGPSLDHSSRSSSDEPTHSDQGQDPEL